MQNVFAALVAMQARLFVAREERDERGQGTLEYVGMIIVAAAIVVAVLEASNTVDLSGAFTEAVNSVIGG